MQPEVRESVASLWEAMAGNRSMGLSTAMWDAMDAALKTGGATVKDVADWIRGDKLVVHDLSTPKHSPYMAAWPTGCTTEEEAVQRGMYYLGKIHGRYIIWRGVKKSTEAEFLESIRKRMGDEGRWLSVKQKLWLDRIAVKIGEEVLV